MHPLQNVCSVKCGILNYPHVDGSSLFFQLRYTRGVQDTVSGFAFGFGGFDLVDAAQIELLDRSKRRTLFVLYLTTVVLLVLSALRAVPRLNDALSGKPAYVRILTETFARQLVAQTQ